MLTLLISVVVSLLSLPAHPNSVTPREEVQLTGGPSQMSAHDLAPLRAQAEGGDATAQLRLAQAYEAGAGVPQDDGLAALWYRRAAEQGNSEAQDSLGAKYLVGQGLEQNKEEAVKWFRVSARQGNASAMYHLGAAYYNGDGVPIDDSLSYAWFTLAKDKGNQRATEALQRAESSLKPGTLSNGLKKIAEMYEGGGSQPENEAEAVRWWSLAASRGDPDAQVTVAGKLINGQGAPQELARARILCNEAAKQENHPAEYCMGYIYQRGLGVSQDPLVARKWFGRAAAGGQIQAMKALASMEAAGEGGRVNRVEAFLLYARLVKTGDQDVLRNLAKLKKEITPKEWEQLQKALQHLRIDPSKLDLALKQIDTQ